MFVFLSKLATNKTKSFSAIFLWIIFVCFFYVFRGANFLCGICEKTLVFAKIKTNQNGEFKFKADYNKNHYSFFSK